MVRCRVKIFVLLKSMLNPNQMLNARKINKVILVWAICWDLKHKALEMLSGAKLTTSQERFSHRGMRKGLWRMEPKSEGLCYAHSALINLLVIL